MKPQEAKNIIFDFGGVIINIDPLQTVKAFGDLTGITEEEAMKVIEDPIFAEFETGKVTEEDLRVNISRILGLGSPIDVHEFEEAWNALVLDLPIERLDLLQALAEKHRLFLLSNTNAIHMRYVSKIVQRTIGKQSIDHLFEKAYYSYEMGLRKPDRKIYDTVINNHQLNPAETIFLDDSPVNFAGAVEAGLHTYHVDKDIRDIFR